MSFLPWQGGLVVALLLAQALAWALGRGLGYRVPLGVQAIGLCLPIVFLLAIVGGGRVLAPVDGPIWTNVPDAPRVADPDLVHGVFNDGALQLLPWEAEVRRSLAAGHLPLWSDVLDGGSSPWVNPQAAVLSPIAMLARLLPLAQFLLGAVAIKMLLAFEGTWLLARRLGARRASAALAAAGFACGGPVVAWAVFPLSSVVAWSPWLLLGVLRVVRRPGARSVAVTALIVGALLLSGHPEIAVAFALLAAGFIAAIWRRGTRRIASRRHATRRQRWWRPIAAAALAAVLGAGLAATALVPFVLVALRSLRGAPGTIASAPAPADAPAGLFQPPGAAWLFASPLNPWAFGRPFHEPFTGLENFPIAAGAYLGLVTLAGAAASIALLAAPGRGGAGRCRRRLIGALLALALGLFLLTTGFLPFRALLALLPLGRAIALDRFLPAAALPLALAAALGLDALAAWRWRAPLAAALAAAAASLALRPAAPLVTLWLLVVLGAALLHRRRAAGLALLALAALLDLGAWDRDALPRGHRELFYPHTPLLAAVAAATAAPGGPWRATAGGFALYPSLLPMYGVADVRVDNPLAPAEQLQPLAEIFGFRPEGRRYKSGFHNLDHPFLDFLNVRAVVLAATAAAPPRFQPAALAAAPAPSRSRVPHGTAPPDSAVGTQPNWIAGGFRVWLNPRALPRFFLPVGADVRERRDALAALRDLGDARRVILLRDEAAGWQPSELPWNSGAVHILHSRPGALALALPSSATTRLLATSLPFPSGWTATAPAAVTAAPTATAAIPATKTAATPNTAAAHRLPLRCLRIDTAYLGVVVPPAVTRIDLAFAPPGLFAGTLASALAAAVIAALLLAGTRTSRAAR